MDEVQKIILKAQKLISEQQTPKSQYKKQIYIRDLIDIQNKIILNHITAKVTNKTQSSKLAFIITNINYILGAKQ